VPVRITNTSGRLLTLELNSGESLHLAPRETSEPIDEIAVDDNAMIQRLEDGGAVAVERAKPDAAPARESGSRRRGTGTAKGED
jgi:hypothetical protein